MEKAKKWVFIGDLHGNFEAATKMAFWALSKKAIPVFLGDLTDSPKTTNKAQLYCIQFVRNLMERGAICLWGNHDLSYINHSAFSCTGYTRTKDAYFRDAYSDLLRHENFKPFYFIKDHNILVTHAGFDKSLIPDHCPKDKTPIEILEDAFHGSNAENLMHTNRYLRVGRNSGGMGTGGIIWLREPEATGPLDDIVQIVGHTPQDTINFNPRTNTWYIDTIEYGDRSILLLKEDGELEIIEEQRWQLQER